MSKNFGGMSASSPTSPSAKLDATIKEIERILGYRIELLNTFGGSLDAVENGYRVLKDHLLKTLRDIQVDPRQDEIENVKKLFAILHEFAIYREVSPIYRDLGFQLCVLGRNWNDNTINDTRLGNDISVITKIIQNKLTLDETIDILKLLIDKAREVYKYEPPAFALSEHYLKTLMDVEREEDECS